MKPLFLVFITAISSNAFSSQLDKDSTIKFYRQVLSCGLPTITCLQNQRLIKPLGHNLFAFNGKLQLRNPDEIISGGRIARFLNLPVVLVPDLPGIKGIPTVDAIVYSNEGIPIANLSLKTFRGNSTNGVSSIKKNFNRARSSHRQLYSYDYLPKIFGFSISPTGEIVANKGTPDQELRQLILKGVLHLLGLTFNGVRPVWLAVDLIDDPFKQFSIVQVTRNEGRIPFEGNFLDVVDERETEEIEYPTVINLDSLVARAGKDNEVSRYVVLIKNDAFNLDKNGYKLTKECAALLNRAEDKSKHSHKGEMAAD